MGNFVKLPRISKKYSQSQIKENVEVGNLYKKDFRLIKYLQKTLINF